MLDAVPKKTMPRPRLPSTLGADLRGVAKLATDATLGVTSVVEAMHQRIARIPGSKAAQDGRTTGITGLVYRSIGGITRLAGGAADRVLGVFEPVLGASPRGRQREAVVAALNGMLGDHLEASGNPLATAMAFRQGGRALSLTPEALAAALPAGGDALLVLVHGLCMNDLQWRHHGHDHGAALARDAGWTPIYLHYNTGRHIAANGREMAQLLQQLASAWPWPLRRFAVLGHSMGGLVARSAIHDAELAQMPWRRQLGDLVCLGTPHLGAPLERAGHWIDQILGAAPYAAPLAKLGKARSAGITDLRHGHLLEGAGQPGLPLPVGVRCHAVAALQGAQAGALAGRILGDGLVPLNSALGRSKNPARRLAFEPARQAVVQGVDHLGLLDSAEVYATLLRWLARDAA
jgi:hypothetical protein